MNDQKRIGVYNPLLKDFSCRYDVSGEGKPSTLTVPAREVRYFPEYLARHVSKHLVDKLINKHGAEPNWEMARDKFMREVLLDEQD